MCVSTKHEGEDAANCCTVWTNNAQQTAMLKINQYLYISDTDKEKLCYLPATNAATNACHLSNYFDNWEFQKFFKTNTFHTGYNVKT